jgi:hypothetical protein
MADHANFLIRHASGELFLGLSDDVDLTRFDGHLTSPRLGAEVFDEISEREQRDAAA